MIERLKGNVGDAYPAARNAVADLEAAADAPSIWIRVRALRLSVDYIAEGMAEIEEKAGRPEMAAEIRTNDFRRFVGAKLGMM